MGNVIHSCRHVSLFIINFNHSKIIFQHSPSISWLIINFSFVFFLSRSGWTSDNGDRGSRQSYGPGTGWRVAGRARYPEEKAQVQVLRTPVTREILRWTGRVKKTKNKTKKKNKFKMLHRKATTTRPSCQRRSRMSGTWNVREDENKKTKK